MSTRPSRGAKLEVQLSRSQSEEWSDLAFRTTIMKELTARARARGRRFVEVHDAQGRELLCSEVGAV